jgi:O-antigen/teichoic acid export membrane protein
LIAQLLRLTKHSAIYGLGHILSRSIGILLLPLHTNYIPPEQYAVYVYGYAFIPVAAIFFSAGLNTGQLKYHIESNSFQEKRIVFSTSFWATGLSGLLLLGLMIATAPDLSTAILGQSNYEHLIFLSLGILFFDALNLLMFNLLRAEERSIEFVSYNFTSMMVNIGLNFYLILVHGAGVEAVFIANAASSVIATILLLPGSRKYFVRRFSGRSLKQMFLFGLPLIPSTVGMVILMAIDRFFIREYIGDEAAALYGAGYRLGMFMSLLVTAFKYAWSPFYLSIAKTDEKANDVFARVLTYFLLISCSIFLIISIYINEIVSLNLFGLTLIDEQYWGGVHIVPAILASYIFYGIFLNMQVGPYVQNKTYLLAITTAMAAE